jgi:hypothetical protein
MGYAASGVVYVTLGLIALQAARHGGETEDTRGAIGVLADKPGGGVLVTLVGIGLLAYAVWRLIEAATGAEGEGHDAKGTAIRVGHAGSGLLYGALGVSALRIARGSSGEGGGSNQADWTARAMALPFGRALVVAAGLGVIGYGLYQLKKAWKSDVKRHLDLHEAGPEQTHWIVRIGRAGLAARGVVFAVIGAFLVSAALRYDPSRAGGLDAALAALSRAPFGQILLGTVAVGLVAYGLFQFVQARYRVVEV